MVLADQNTVIHKNIPFREKSYFFHPIHRCFSRSGILYLWYGSSKSRRFIQNRKRTPQKPQADAGRMRLVLRRWSSIFLGARKRQAIPTLGQSDASPEDVGSQDASSRKREKIMKQSVHSSARIFTMHK